VRYFRFRALFDPKRDTASMNTDHIRSRIVVHGRVQGVFYRDTCRRQAGARAVTGWVRNRPDGTVEAVFEGPQRDVDAMVEWARLGPRSAHVMRIERFDEAPRGEVEFRIR
jgi:acylphosphatase